MRSGASSGITEKRTSSREAVRRVKIAQERRENITLISGKGIMRDFVRKETDPKFLRVVETEYKLHDALKLLFDLLEEYGPVWYAKEHHDQALYALNLPMTRQPVSASKSYRDLKQAA
jgi:hypothetical protein